MTTNTTDRRLVRVALTIGAVFVVLPAFAMGFGMAGHGPMMGGTWSGGMWGAGGWAGWLFGGVLMPLFVLALVVGTLYLGYRAVTAQDGATDPALAELRAAYARGELSDDEYERRRERLETEQ